MITSKQRAFLRGLANKIQATVQIGKGGIGDNMLTLIEETLEKHELVKVHVLENSFSDPRDLCHEVASLVGAEEVQVIGNKFVLYKQSKENKKIDIKTLTVRQDTQQKAKKQVKPLYKAKANAAKEKKRLLQEKEKRNKFFKAQRSKSYTRKG